MLIFLLILILLAILFPEGMRWICYLILTIMIVGLLFQGTP